MNDVGSCVQEGDEQLATEILPRLEFVIVNTVFCYGLAGLALLLRGRLRFFTEPKVSHKAKRITLFVLVFINVTLCVLASADSEFLFLTVTLFFGLITTEESYICSLILFSLLFYGLLVGISSTSYRGMVTLVVLNIAAYCTPMYIFLHYMQRLGV